MNDIIKSIVQFPWLIPILIIVVLSVFLFFYIGAAPNSILKFLGFIEITKPEKPRIWQLVLMISVTLINSLIFSGYLIIKKNPIPLPQNNECIVHLDDCNMHMNIEAEADAANRGDITIIKNIFASNATIFDVKSDKKWNDPINFYSNKFNETSYSNAINYSIQQTKRNENEAIFICASQGKYANKRNPMINGDYNNPQGSNEWVFRKDSIGCWKIIRFTFNIK